MTATRQQQLKLLKLTEREAKIYKRAHDRYLRLSKKCQDARDRLLARFMP